MKKPLVSIIIPVYNGANYLAEAIDSALKQTYKNIEVLVINDGSTDNGETDKIAKSYGNKIRYFKKVNGGVASALNLGVEEMKGEYFSWLSHDDLYFANKVEKELKVIETLSPRSVVYCNYKVINESGEVTAQSNLKPLRYKLPFALIKDRFIHGCSLLIPKQAFTEAGLFKLELRHTQDFDLWFRLMALGYKFHLVSDHLIAGRRHLNQDSVKKSDQLFIEEDELYKNALNLFMPKIFFTPRQNVSLSYLDLAINFKILGLAKASKLAYELSQKHLTLIDWPFWFIKNLIYILWFRQFSKPLQLLVQVVRKIKRLRKRGNQNISQNKTDKRIHLCLIGNINSSHNLKLLDFLKEQNFQITFISTRKGIFPGIKVISVARKKFEPVIFWFFRFIFTTGKIIKKISPDIVQGNSLTPGGIAACFSGFRPFVVYAWGSDIYNFSKYNFFLKKMVQKTLREANIILGTSEAMVSTIKKISCKNINFQSIRFGIDLETFRKKKNNLAHKMALDNCRIVLCPRSIGKIYNSQNLIKAIAGIKDENTKLALINSSADWIYYNQVKSYITKNNLENKIIFLPPVANRDMVEYYNLADTVISVTDWDGCSVSVLEAMAAEAKIITNQLPYLKDFIEDKNIWITSNNPADITRTIKSALKIPKEQYQPIGKRNRRIIAQKANLKNCFLPLLKTYKNLQ